MGECLQTLEGHGSSVQSVAFSHNSRLLASASGDRTVKVWDVAMGQCLQTLEGHGGWVASVAFSHDSRLLASASDDDTVEVWDAAMGECLQTLKISSSSKIAFDPTDSYLLTEVGLITLGESSSVMQTDSKPGDADAVPHAATAVATTATGAKLSQECQ